MNRLKDKAYHSQTILKTSLKFLMKIHFDHLTTYTFTQCKIQLMLRVMQAPFKVCFGLIQIKTHHFCI